MEADAEGYGNMCDADLDNDAPLRPGGWSFFTVLIDGRRLLMLDLMCNP